MFLTNTTLFVRLILARQKGRKVVKMTQVNMLEAKSNLSKLVKDLEQHQEDTVLIARDGKPVVMMVRIPQKESVNRFGIAEGVFTVPEDFDSWDNEIADMFEESI